MFLDITGEYFFSICTTIALLWLIHKARLIVWPPANFPANIPTVPFYVTFIGAVTNWDQEKIYNVYYREKLEKHGAVKVYFASRWNVLVTRPEYLVQMLRCNDIFEKSGNQKKIPDSVLANYTGDNVISAGNENWKLYRKIVTSSILFPDLTSLDGNIENFVSELKASASRNSVAVTSSVQKFTLANIGDCVLGVDLHFSSPSGLQIYQELQLVKAQIFRPLFMNFPFLDSLPLKSRVAAHQSVKSFKKHYCQKIINEITPENLPRLGPVLATSYEHHEISEKQFQDNAIIVLVAGHENPQLLITSLLYVIAKHPGIQKRLRCELTHFDGDKEQSLFLNAVIYETIRLYPPIGQIINRKTTQRVVLGDNIVIPEGTYVGYNNFGTQRDPNYWESPDHFSPTRWGNSYGEIQERYSTAKSRCTLPAFHGRTRACLGEKFALKQVRKLLAALIEEFEFRLDPEWNDRLTSAGPICPLNLKLRVRQLTELATNTRNSTT